MDIKERLRIKNNVKTEDMTAPPDKVRIAELEAENADLKTQLSEAQDALIELADIIAEVE